MTSGKRIFTSAVASVLAFAALASPLGPRQALSRAQKAVGAATDSRLRKAVLTHDYRLAETFSVDGSAAIYLFVSPKGGFLVAPADDCAMPVSGYSDNGTASAGDMPAAMRWWLRGLAGEVAQAAREAGTAPAQSTVRTERAAIAPMLTTLWDQGAPFNDLCPELDGVRTFTGCAATAMAQAMNHFRAPATGSRSVSYLWHGQTLSMDFAQTTFDWDNMADDYRTTSTEAQKNAVATLMKACGYSLKSNYSTTATEAKPQDIVPALVRNFGYARSTMQLYRQFYQSGEWQDSIYASLAAGSPVIYTGQGSQGGHAFVCDGYQGDGYFHFNWGWSGKSNGWFLLSALNPEALGTGGGAGGFNSAQTAVTRLRTAYAGATYVPVMGTGASYAIACNPDASSLTLSGGIYNYATTAMNYSVGFSIESLAGGDIRYIGAGNWNLTEALYGYGSYTRETGTALAPGQYRVRAAYQYRDASGAPQWRDALVPVSAPAAWILTVGDTAAIAPESRDIILSASGWKLKSPAFALHAGLNISLEAEIANTGTEEATNDFHTVFYRDGRTKPSYTLAATSITIAPGEKEKYDFFGALPASMTPGRYAMYLAYRPYGSESYTLLTDSIGVEILPACGAITLKTPSWQLHDSGNVDGAKMEIDMTLTCTKGCYANTLLFFFQNKNADGSFTTFGNTCSEPIWLNQGDTAQYHFVLALPDYKPGTDYRLVVNYKNAEGKNTFLCRKEFTTAAVTATGADAGAFSVRVAGGQAYVSAPCRVRALNCYGIDGRLHGVFWQETPSGAEADLRMLSPGIYLLRCILADGTTATRKLRL